MENEYKTAIINIANELSKRCAELVNPIPEDERDLMKKFDYISDIASDTSLALFVEDADGLNEIVNNIKEERLKEYENEEAERDRENA